MSGGWTGQERPAVIERTQGIGGELQLQRRGAHYEIIYNGVFLMATYNGASERAAVRRALMSLPPAGAPGPGVLMGGLGVGYSLREALDRLPAGAKVVVAEIEPAVIEWNRIYLKEINGGALGDPRVEIRNEPFEDVLRKEAVRFEGGPGGYRLVFADTDNGSSWLSRDENAAIYSETGLKTMHRCLAPGGAACFWCCRREPDFEARLARLFGPPAYETVMEVTGQEAGFYLCLKQSSQ